jgi:DNA-binding transcriptional MerR regulator
MPVLLETDRWLRTGVAARQIGVTKPTLISWGEKGVGPRFTVLPSGERRYRLSDVTAWLKAREIGGDK